MGKSIGILMGLRCKRRLEYSSDFLREIVIKPNKLDGGHEYPSKPIPSD
jgi:hypothetical protein